MKVCDKTQINEDNESEQNSCTRLSFQEFSNILAQTHLKSF